MQTNSPTIDAPSRYSAYFELLHFHCNNQNTCCKVQILEEVHDLNIYPQDATDEVEERRE